jgi:SOS-response transcriptional repressor LexA
MSVSVGEEVISKILAIVRSHPEGVTVEQMMEGHGFTNSNVIHAALRVLEERVEIQGHNYRRPRCPWLLLPRLHN